MALNLSTLTSPATSGEVLAEVLTTADFLEPVPVLRNLARGSNKGGDAKQDVALNQPKALPLIDGDGYLYLSGVTGNYASVPSSTDLDVLGDIDIQATFPKIESNGGTQTFMGRYASGSKVFLLQMANARTLYFYRFSQLTTSSAPLSEAAKGVKATHRVSDDRVQFFETLDGTVWTQVGTDKTLPANTPFAGTSDFEVGTWSNGVNSPLTGPIQRCIVKDGIDGTTVLDVDFTSTNVRHGATKFQCATGQVVTINQDSSSSNDVATIIKKSVLRFDGVNDFMDGVFGQTITGGYLFAAFSVLGDGGEPYGRVFGINSTGLGDASTGGYAQANYNKGSNTLYQAYNGIAWRGLQQGIFDDSMGDILLESKFKSGSQVSKVNNANEANGTTTDTGDLSSEQFNIVADATGDNNAAIDLEYLALFDASITDAQADAVRNYINKRNNVFSLVDNSYYFFDPQKATFTGNFTAVNTLDGYITGSDLGDTDVRSNLTLEQGTLNDQPSTDGYKITFNDSAEHLEFVNAASQNLSGWQVCGTSLGTFVYRVQGAVTELNLLGNAGLIRLIGDLYGIILLPESATGKDIEEARKLLIDRGASDAAGGSSFYGAWYERRDMVTFKNSSFPDATNFAYSWENCVNLSNLETLHAPSGTSFVGAWRGTAALTSFPADAKLGTSAQSVDFTSAWQDSGLTSFPALDLSSGSTFFNAFRSTQITTIESGVLLGTASASANVNFQNAFRDTPLTSLPEDFNLSKGKYFTSAWQGCTALTSFPSDALLGTEANNVNFSSAWQSSGLTSFPSDIDLSKGTNFFSSWFGCSSLTSFPSIDLSNGTNFYASWYLSGITNFSASAKLGENAINVSFREAFRASALTSFSTPLNNGNHFFRAWRDCNSLVDFSVDVFTNWNPSSITSGVFNDAWLNCTSLTAQSVENILVSIDASGHYATTNKVSGGTALADAGIDIDYNGDPLTAATTAAITSLKSKGWSIFINSVEQ
jgi:hypothetical protein